jgi:hypothetical protein
MLDEAELRLLRTTVRINTLIMAVALGLLGGAILWLSTIILLVRDGEHVGRHLSLLAVFFPGYGVTWSGAWIGLLWGFVFGGLSGAILYWSYARTLRERLPSMLLPPADGVLPQPTMLLSGNALGIGLGALLALQLLVTTNWLVIRGTASYSDNAALLGQYLPGYTVSFAGSIIGALELFAAAFVVSHVLAAVYNFVARSTMQ